MLGAIVPKEIEPTKFPNFPKHDPNATCRYCVGYIGHSTKANHVGDHLVIQSFSL